MKKHRRQTLLALAISAASTAAISAESLLEEVVVTAQRRAENVQDVPIAISAFTAAGLKKAGINSSDELSVVTPGLQMGRQIGSSTPFLRGVGTTNTSAGDESSIALYVDGIYSPAMSANIYNFNNIERIEVLKGPQGTLFGRNAAGGLIHIITRDPEQEFSGSAEIGYGNYEKVQSQFYMTGGLNDKLAADIAILYEDQGEGFGTNLFNGDEIGYAEAKALRSKWLFDASESTSVRLSADYSKSRSDIAINTQPAPGTAGFDGALIFAGCSAGADQVPGTADDVDAATCAGVAAAGANRYTGDWYDVNQDSTGYYETRRKGLSLRVDHSFGRFDLVSLTGYQESDTYQLIDQDATPQNFIDVQLGDYSETFTQELHLLSDNDDRLEWMVGGFFMDASAGYDPLSISGFGAALQLPGAQEIRSTPNQDTQSVSAFAQGSYDLTAKARLTLGARMTKDTRTTQVMTTADFGTGFMTLDQGEIDDSWTEPTWRVALDYQLSDTTLLFGSLSRGFKSGVYNLISVAASPAAGGPSDPVDPETLDAIEVGVKADLFDDHVRLNASVFTYRYEDLQVQRVVSGASQLLNAAESEITGFESDVTWAVNDRLSMNAGVSVLDAEFSSFPNAPSYTPTGFGSNVLGQQDASGNKVGRTPDLTYNIGLNYMIPSDHGRYDLSLHYYYNDGYFWEADNTLEQEDYTIVNAELGWESLDGTWEARLYAKNILDEEYSYFSYRSELGDNVSAAEPMLYGVSLKYNF